MLPILERGKNIMTIIEATRRLCALVSEVGEKKFKHELVHDCICGDNPIGERVDEPVIEFIEEAVRNALRAT